MTISVRAVFFDFGGTLFSYRSFGKSMGSVMRLACVRAGISAEGREVGRAWRAASEEAWRTIGTQPFYLHRDVFAASFAGMIKELGGALSDDTLSELLTAQNEALFAAVQPREDCAETLGALRQAGHYLSIVSNIDDDQLDGLVAACEVGPLLDHWSSSEEAKSCKPEPGMFELALEKAGNPDPSDVLFVGDSPVHDIAGAQALGMRTALIAEEGIAPPAQGEGTRAQADYTIRSLSELLRIVGAG
jgi:putative hydrolase of the HAD superfamily